MKPTKIVTAFLSLTLMTYFSAHQVRAEVILFSEDFSTGLDRWLPVRDAGASWKVLDGKAQATITTGSTLSELVPKDEFWDSSWKNIEYELEFTPLAGLDRNLSFGYLDNANRYDIHFLSGGFIFSRIKNGYVPFSRNLPFNLVNGQSYQVKIKQFNGHITLTIDNQVVMDEADLSYDGNAGKISMIAGAGSAYPTKVLYDDIVVRALDNTSQPLPSPTPVPQPSPPVTPHPSPSASEVSLNVPLLRQDDPLWGSQEYDTARKWSNQPTISRWGCALTSMAMIMQFYGMHTLPSGQPLTPQTLNTWLKSQPDGYVGDGALNWLAVTRLTRLISSNLNTPKLEYSAKNGADMSLAQAEITHQKPVILQVDGHFVVGKGNKSDPVDLLIHDPAKENTSFSSLNKPLLSTRLFQPTQTDLSYLLLVHQPQLQITVKNSQGQTMVLEAVIDTLTAENNSPESSPTFTQTYLPKPADGIYSISVSQSQLKPYQLQIFSYDKQGNASSFQPSGMVGPNPLQLQLEYSSSKPSQLKPKGSLRQFRQDWQWLKKSGVPMNALLYLAIDKLCALGQDLPLRNQRNIAELMIREINRHPKLFSSNTRQYLLQQLLHLQQH